MLELMNKAMTEQIMLNYKIGGEFEYVLRIGERLEFL